MADLDVVIQTSGGEFELGYQKAEIAQPNKVNVNTRVSAKPNAQILVYAIASELPAIESPIVSVFKISIQDSIINSNICKAYISSEERVEDSQLITIKDLIQRVQEALEFVGFWGSITIKFIGRKLIMIDFSRSIGFDKKYCSLCNNGYDTRNCQDCKPEIDPYWLELP